MRTFFTKHKTLCLFLAGFLAAALLCGIVWGVWALWPKAQGGNPPVSSAISSTQTTSVVTSNTVTSNTVTSNTATSNVVTSNTVTSAPPATSVMQTTSTAVGSKNPPVSSNTEVTPSLPTPTQPPAPAPVTEKVCYLTFDDGPSQNTLEILDILDDYDAKATFFVVGSMLNSSSGKAILQKTYRQGHAIGLHANNHTYSKIYASKNAFYADLAAISNKVYDIIGIRPAITRFPGGSSNTVSMSHDGGIKIMTQLTKELPKMGYQYFDWNVDSNDASGNNVAADKIYNSVVNQTWSGTRKEICVLMHDTAAKDTTVEALPRILEKLQSQGYEFRGLDPSVSGFHHGVNN